MEMPSDRPTKISERPKDSGFSAVAPTAAAPEPATAIPAPTQARPVEMAAARLAYGSPAAVWLKPAAEAAVGENNQKTPEPVASIPTSTKKPFNPITISRVAFSGA